MWILFLSCFTASFLQQSRVKSHTYSCSLRLTQDDKAVLHVSFRCARTPKVKWDQMGNYRPLSMKRTSVLFSVFSPHLGIHHVKRPRWPILILNHTTNGASSPWPLESHWHVHGQLTRFTFPCIERILELEPRCIVGTQAILIAIIHPGFMSCHFG